ncbi:uncharacterized protein LOC135924132 [Gordionus sp. m RMFG-2023]|uniref:uncharacterized protein LOC135924132 n=1 Tax=Gordionus sp. m RMFG-2023 TaxID=3053472 RepID=UPI0031FCF3B4
MDDVLITGLTAEQHNQRLEEVFKRIQDKGLQASKEKSILGVTEIVLVIKLKCSLLGMINYYHRFVDNFAKIAAPLYDLLKKGVNFEWKIEQRNAFENLKRKIGEEPISVCFNNDLEIILAVDASNKGVGGALLHVIDGFSRIFHEVETRYSVIEQEALAIIFGLTKCREYLIGKRFVIYTDHKPLIHLYKKDNKELMMSPRLQRWLLLVGSFNVDIKYRRGRENHLPDILSRLGAGCATPEIIDNMIIDREDALVRTLSYMLKGGPTTWEDLKSYTLKDKGQVKMKSWAREYVWWPGMGNDIEKITKEYVPCNTCAVMPRKEMGQVWPKSKKPWDRLHIYFFELDKKSYFLVVDSYSKWIEFEEVQGLTTKVVIKLLQKLWAKFGIPKIIVSDGGPAFISENFKQFCNSIKIKHILTPPYHPSSNGQAERMVDIVKNWIKRRNKKKMKEGVTPVELFLGRRTRLPLDFLKSKEIDNILSCEKTNIKFPVGKIIWGRLFDHKKKWEKGCVIDNIGNKLCTIRFDDGTMGVRHNDFIRVTDKGGISCFRCQSFGHQIKDCQIPTHVLMNQECKDYPSDTEKFPTSSYFCGKNNKVPSEVKYQNYNKINEIESRYKQYGNRQWPPIKYDGMLKRTNIIQDRTVGITSMGNQYYGKMQAKNDNSTKLRSNIVKVTNNTDVQKKYNVMETEEEEILKDKEEDI